jgi:EAL domain-containing protein (putative c-di-GMP-specific phosphodiesterase class I)
LQPAQFLPIAEQTGTLMDIDEFVLREACRQRACWEAQMAPGVKAPFVSVNVAGWQFFHPQRWWRVLAMIAPQTGDLRLEMMESVLVTRFLFSPPVDGAATIGMLSKKMKARATTA